MEGCREKSSGVSEKLKRKKKTRRERRKRELHVAKMNNNIPWLFYIGLRLRYINVFVGIDIAIVGYFSSKHCCMPIFLRKSCFYLLELVWLPSEKMVTTKMY